MYDKTICPVCKSNLLVYLGDWDDCTYPDVEAVQCEKCGTAFLMGTEDVQKETLYDVILNHFSQEGDRDYFVINTIPQMVDDLICGKSWENESLSDFLKHYAYIETGKEI